MDIVISLQTSSCCMGGTVNQVLHGISCVLGSSQSEVELGNFLRVFIATFQEGVV